LWKWLVIILAAVSIVLFPVTALAAITQDVTITATPGYGIVSFTIDYISDTQMDLSWTVSGDVTKVMVRAKYGEDLDEIPDEDTAPTDGYLVYYDTGNSVSDTSLNFDENPGPLFYKIWGQKEDGKWYTGGLSAWEESAVMTLLGMLAFAGILSFLAFRSSFKPMRFVAGFSWVAVLVYWILSPPSAVAAGSAAHIAVMLVLIFAAFAVSVSGFGVEENRQRSVNGESSSSSIFKIKRPNFMSSEEQTRAAIQRKREDDNVAYRSRVRSALRPKGEIRRR
jgi:hypothetical protein